MAIIVSGAVLLVVHTLLVLTVPASAPAAAGLSKGAALLAIPLGVMLAVPVMLGIRVPRNPVGWLLAGSVIGFGLLSTGSDYLTRSQALHDVPAVLETPMGFLGIIGWATSFPLLLILVPLFFPDGRLLSRRWRPVAWLAAFSIIFTAVTSMLDPNTAAGGGTQVTLLGLLNGPIASAMTFALIIAAATSLVLRYRRANRELRQQLKWFVAAVVVAILGVAPVLFGASGALSNIVLTVALMALPVAILIAVLRYRLYDIDVVISRALIFGALAVFITAIYVGIVVGVGTLIGSGSRPNLALSIVATGIVAVGFQPVRERVTRVANRLVYGRRASPYEVLAEFSEHMAGSLAADEVLPRMAQVLAEGTGAELAAVWLQRDGELVRAAAWPPGTVADEPAQLTAAALGKASGNERAVAVKHEGELLGALTLRKRRGEPLTPIEQKLLEDLASQAGLVLRNVGLASDLRAHLAELRLSRQRLVAAQDEERRRLERNLHDGAQQHLVAMKVKLGLARKLARPDPERARLAIAGLKDDAGAALETVRDLARGIYPPLLAEQGLVAALNAQARRAVVPVVVEADGTARYSQEVESAAYFCVLEALQNVQKYAVASGAAVRFSNNPGELRFEVVDDGRGFDPHTAVRGAGLTNMADRVDALGGTLAVASSPGQGTAIRVTLPADAVR